jgi:hypothetical protein
MYPEAQPGQVETVGVGSGVNLLAGMVHPGKHRRLDRTTASHGLHCKDHKPKPHCFDQVAEAR